LNRKAYKNANCCGFRSGKRGKIRCDKQYAKEGAAEK
jgi:hypothetical protein